MFKYLFIFLRLLFISEEILCFFQLQDKLENMVVEEAAFGIEYRI